MTDKLHSEFRRPDTLVRLIGTVCTASEGDGKSAMVLIMPIAAAIGSEAALLYFMPLSVPRPRVVAPASNNFTSRYT